MASRGLAVAQVLHPAEGPVEFVQACASLQEFVHRSLGEAKAAAIAPAKFRFFCLGVTVDLVPCECTLSFLASVAGRPCAIPFHWCCHRLTVGLQTDISSRVLLVTVLP